MGTQGPKVRNLGQASHAEEVQNCKASSVSWRLVGRENTGPAEQVNYVYGSILGTRKICKAHHPPTVACKRPHVDTMQYHTRQSAQEGSVRLSRVGSTGASAKRLPLSLKVHGLSQGHELGSYGTLLLLFRH